MILGSDHSHYDWRGWDSVTGGYYYIPINFASSQAVFVFLKACDGKYDTPFYQNAMTDARKAGKYAAPYVWLYARNHTDPKAQADFWYSRLKDEPLIAIDFEGYGDSYPDYDDLYNAIERLKADGYKGKIIIYTGYYYWLAHGSTASYWTQFPVWLARYSAYPPQPTPPFAKEIIWQFSATGDPVKYGITNGKMAVDENWFYGTDAELAELFGGEIIPPVEIGETMYQGTVLAGTLNVRNAPSTGAVIGLLYANDKVEADKVVNGWWHLTKIRGAAVTAESWAYEGSTKNYIRTDAIVTPPAGLPTINIRLEAEGYPPFEGVWKPS